MYIVTRRYRLPEEALKEVVTKTEQGVLNEFHRIPGFIDYYYLHSDGSVMVVGIFEDRKSAEESTRIAADWVQKNIPGRYAGPPEIFSGDVLIHSPKMQGRGRAAS